MQDVSSPFWANKEGWRHSVGFLGRHIESNFRLHFVRPKVWGAYELCDNPSYMRGLRDGHMKHVNGLGAPFLSKGACAKIREGQYEDQSITLSGGFLELPVRGLLQAGGGLKANLRHTVGNLNPQEQSHLQGRHPIRRCHHTAEGFYLSWHRGGLCLLNHVPLL